MAQPVWQARHEKYPLGNQILLVRILNVATENTIYLALHFAECRARR